jgi:hypothetical protein
MSSKHTNTTGPTDTVGVINSDPTNLPTGDSSLGSPPGKEPLPNLDSKEFDLSQFAVSTELEEHAGGTRLLTTIPVRKPSKESWFRTHPDSKTFWFRTYLVELREAGEVYLAIPEVRDFLLDRGEQTFVKKILIPTITKQGTLFLWPIRLPDSEGKLDSWNQSALEAAAIARNKWVRINSDRQLGAYQVIARDGGEEPQWPPQSIGELLKTAFKGRVIDSLDHPVIAELTGTQSAPRQNGDVLAKFVDMV